MHLSVAANVVAPRLSEIAHGPFIDLRAENKIGAKEIAEILDFGAGTASRSRRTVGR